MISFCGYSVDPRKALSAGLWAMVIYKLLQMGFAKYGYWSIWNVGQLFVCAWLAYLVLPKLAQAALVLFEPQPTTVLVKEPYFGLIKEHSLKPIRRPILFLKPILKFLLWSLLSYAIMHKMLQVGQFRFEDFWTQEALQAYLYEKFPIGTPAEPLIRLLGQAGPVCKLIKKNEKHMIKSVDLKGKLSERVIQADHYKQKSTPSGTEIAWYCEYDGEFLSTGIFMEYIVIVDANAAHKILAIATTYSGGT
jgi:hypothetical protein